MDFGEALADRTPTQSGIAVQGILMDFGGADDVVQMTMQEHLYNDSHKIAKLMYAQLNNGWTYTLRIQNENLNEHVTVQMLGLRNEHVYVQ